jgi:hypothetical protein
MNIIIMIVYALLTRWPVEGKRTTETENRIQKVFLWFYADWAKVANSCASSGATAHKYFKTKTETL